MNLELYICYGQSGHLAWAYLKQSHRLIVAVKAQAVLVKELTITPDSLKKELVALSYLREIFVWAIM